MSTIDVKVLQFSKSVSEGTPLQWKKRMGEAIAQDEILVEIETGKVVLEKPAPSAGTFAALVKTNSDRVHADDMIASIDTNGKAAAAA